MDVNLIIRGIDKTAALADQNALLLKAVKSQYLHFELNPDTAVTAL